MANSYSRRIGATGTQRFRGIIVAEEYNPTLRGSNLRREIEKMRRSDTTVHMILEMVKRPISSVVWDVEPASDEASDITIAENVRADLFDNPHFTWDSFLEQGLTYLDFGFCVFELTGERRDINGQMLVGTSDIGYRKQTTIESWETEDGKEGVKQLIMGDPTRIGQPSYANIPMDKLVVLTHKKEGDNYEGISMLRPAYKDWDMKDKLQLVMAVGSEKVAIPTPVLSVDDSISLDTNDLDPAIANTVELLRQIRANEEGYLIKRKSWDLETMDMSNQGVKDLLPIIKYFDHQMQMSILAPFMGLGSEGSSGSRAVGDVQYKPYVLQEEAIAKEIQHTVQTQWINRICDLNYSTLPNGYPKLTHSKIQEDDMGGLAEVVSKLSSAGMLTANFDTEQHVRKLAHLPELTEEDRAAYEEAQAMKKELEKKALEAPAVQPGKPTDKKPASKAEAALRTLRQANRQAMDIFY